MQRALKGIELAFANPVYQENLVLGIKFTESKYVLKAVENFKKIFSGFRLKINDGHYYQKDVSNVTVHKIPNWIQDCRTANFWVFDNHTLPINEGLATIAANDHIVVINSSHILSDGGFMVSALNNCLNDMSHEKIYKDAPLYSSDAFKDEFTEAKKKIDKNIIWPMDKLTKCKYDTNDKHLGVPGTQYIDFEETIPVTELGCYDRINKKPKNLTEMSSLGIAMSILALNKVNNNVSFSYDEPIALTTVLDVRRFSKSKTNTNWSFGNCVAQPSIKADVSKSDTINDVCLKFKNYIKLLQPHGAFYSAGHMADLRVTPPKSIFGCLSSIGPIRFKRPIVDFDIRDCARTKLGAGDHGEQLGSQFTIVSYSKSNEYKNDFFYFTRYCPALITMENINILFRSFQHFIKKVPLSASFDDTFNDLVEFQKSLKRDF